MVDNNLRYSIKQILGSLIFRLFYSKYADYYLVSGIKSRQLLEFFGFHHQKYITDIMGILKSISLIKSVIIHLKQREKAFVFVGQKIHRKGIDVLIKSYLNYLSNGGEWKLKIIGSGNYKIPKIRNIIQYDFMQPREVSKLYQKNYAFILPSRLEHWGDSSCRGCSVWHDTFVIKKGVGSHPDLLMPGINGFLFDINNEMELVNLFFKIQSLDQNQLKIMSNKSREIASKFSEDSFAIAINSILNS